MTNQDKIMKLIILSDIHEQYLIFTNKIKEEAKHNKIDYILIAGDITNFGILYENQKQIDLIKNWFEELILNYNCPILYIPGNHDIGLDKYDFNNPNIINVLNIRYVLSNGTGVVGMSLATAFDMPQLASIWANTTKSRDYDEIYYSSFNDLVFEGDIILSHCPPFGVLDRTPYGSNIGSPGLYNLIGKTNPSYVVCGHVHESCGEDYLLDERNNLKIIVFNTATEVRIITV